MASFYVTRSALLVRVNADVQRSQTGAPCRRHRALIVTSRGDDDEINSFRVASQTKHFLSLARVISIDLDASLFLKYTFHRRLGHCLTGNAVNNLLSCNLSSVARIYLFHFIYLKKIFSLRLLKKCKT